MVARDFQENVDPNYYLNVGIKKVTINCLWASLLTYIDEIFSEISVDLERILEVPVVRLPPPTRNEYRPSI